MSGPDSGSVVAIAANTLSVADRNAGLHVFDVTDPHDPRVIGNVNPPSDAIRTVPSE